MATNSKREQIIVYMKTLLEELTSIKTVVRVKQSYSNLEQFAETQFSVAAIVAGLPEPDEKMSARSPGNVDLVISRLGIQIVVYGREKVNPDTLVSNLADDIWAKLYSDQRFGGLTLGLTVVFDSDPQFWEPYVAFQINCSIKYKHDKGGI